MKNNTFYRTLFIIGALQLFIFNSIFFCQVALSQTKQTNTPQALDADKSTSQNPETSTLKQAEKEKEPDNKAQAKPSSPKETINDLSPKKIKEMAAQILSPIPKGKVIAFVDFTDASDKVTTNSQSIFLQVEPIVIAEGNRIGLSFIERKDLKLIMDEWNLNLALGTERADPGAQALLGADYILTGKVLITDNTNLCTLKLVDLLSGKIVNSVSGKINGIKEEKKLQATIEKPSPTPLSAQNNAVKNSSYTIISNDSKLSMWTSKWTYTIGDKFEIFFTVTEPLYVQIVDITPDGKINKIFPNDSQKDNYCLPGKTYKIPSEKSDYELLVTPPAGVDRIMAVASPAAMDVTAVTKTRGIQFTKTLVSTTQTRANLSIVIQ